MVAALEDRKPKGFGVWAENWIIVMAFLAVATQWRTTAMADGRLLFHGLDYVGARAGLEGDGIALDPRQWAGLRTMEAAASAWLNGYRS